MLTGFEKAAKKIAITLGLAAFVSSSIFATPDPLSSLEDGLSDLVYALSRSVVTVEASRSIPYQSFSSPTAAVESHVASGLILDTSGSILVAASSVFGHNQYSVSLDNQTVPATLVGVDYVENVALLQAAHSLGKPVNMAARHACAGQMVISLGNSFGVRASPSIGFCAGMREDGNTQFSLPSSSCTFGGGIFTLSGELLGIIIDNVGQGGRVSIAVPAYRLSDVVDYLKAHGDRFAGFVGIATGEIEVSPALPADNPAIYSASAGRPQLAEVESGLMVTQILPGSPAERGGLIPGDIILAVDHQKITTPGELATLIGRTTPGSRIQLDLMRRNSRISIPLQVGARTGGLAPTNSASPRAESGNALADSLYRALSQLKDEVSRLEERLNSLY